MGNPTDLQTFKTIIISKGINFLKDKLPMWNQEMIINLNSHKTLQIKTFP